jgi:hypothetical protein
VPPHPTNNPTRRTKPPRANLPRLHPSAVRPRSWRPGSPTARAADAVMRTRTQGESYPPPAPTAPSCPCPRARSNTTYYAAARRGGSWRPASSVVDHRRLGPSAKQMTDEQQTRGAGSRRGARCARPRDGGPCPACPPSMVSTAPPTVSFRRARCARSALHSRSLPGRPLGSLGQHACVACAHSARRILICVTSDLAPVCMALPGPETFGVPDSQPLSSPAGRSALAAWPLRRSVTQPVRLVGD